MEYRYPPNANLIGQHRSLGRFDLLDEPFEKVSRRKRSQNG